MQRVMIIGCGGSGKTVLARQLGARLDIAVTHLDGVYFDADWNRLDGDAFAHLQRELVAADRWIIDGNYASTMAIRLARADTVIFLDLPTWVCLWGIAARRWRYRGGQHPDGVYDRISWSVIAYVWGYRRRMRPRVTRMVDAYAAETRYIRLTSRRSVTRFLASVDPPGEPA